MNRFARYVLAASALKNTSTPCKPCTFAQYGTATATTTAAVGPWLAARFGRQHLLASGVAAVVSTMGVVLASSAACEDATPLQQLHLRMLRQWLTDNGACVDALEFCTAQVRCEPCRLALLPPIARSLRIKCHGNPEWFLRACHMSTWGSSPLAITHCMRKRERHAGQGQRCLRDRQHR